MPTRNINLTEHYDRFVAEQVRAGRYKNASEVLRAGLHLLEQQSCEEREKLALLRALAKEGFDRIDQGQGIEINGSRQLSEFITGLGTAAAKGRKSGGNGR